MDKKAKRSKAIADQAYVMSKIDDFMRKNLDDDKFKEFSQEELDEKLVRINHLYSTYEDKCMDLNAADGTLDTDKGDEIEAQCESIKSKIKTRLRQLAKQAEQSAQTQQPAANS